MSSNFTLKVIGVAMALWVGADSRADDTFAASEAHLPDGDLSLLGQVFGTLSYSYINQDGTTAHADNYAFELNQPLAFGLDGLLSYDFSQSSLISGARPRQYMLAAGLRAFSTSYNWGKPYLEAVGGYVWKRYRGTSDNSYSWQIGAGAEFQVIRRATLTPYVQYANMPDLAGAGTWNMGVKGSYWIGAAWAVTTGIERTDEQNTAFTVGTNVRY